RVINASERWVTKSAISAKINGKELTSVISDIPPLSVYKMPFTIPSTILDTSSEKVNVDLELKDKDGRVVSTESLPLAVKSQYTHHKRPISSGVDGIIQHYRVAPDTNQTSYRSALSQSSHGASVAAVNPDNAYKQKE